MNESQVDFRDVQKIIMVGDAGTGKSHIVYCYVKEKVPNNIMPTVAVEFAPKLALVDNRRVKVQIWDTAGQQTYRSLTMSYYHNVQAALVVFDVSRRATFEHVPYWLQSLRQRADSHLQIILVAHKVDHSRREVTRQEGQQLASREHILYAQTSIKDISSIQQAFSRVISGVLAARKHRESIPQSNQVRLGQRQEQRGGCSC